MRKGKSFQDKGVTGTGQLQLVLVKVKTGGKGAHLLILPEAMSGRGRSSEPASLHEF